MDKVVFTNPFPSGVVGENEVLFSLPDRRGSLNKVLLTLSRQRKGKTFN